MRKIKNDPILGNRIWLIPISFCLLLISCLNDIFEPNGMDSGRGNKELTIEIARSWYNRHYMPVFGMHTRSASGETRSSERLLKPDWEKAQENHRGRYEVVETPLKMQGSSIITDVETAERWNQNQPPKFIRNVSRMVVLKDKKTGTIRSFIMIFVGSYNYLQKSRTMGKNSYLRREKDFDGSVLFYEMDGTFINGWSYSEGRIVATLSPAADDEHPRHSYEPPRTRAFDNCFPSCFTTYTTQCTEESAYATFDEEYGAALSVTGGNCFTVDITECVTRCDYGGGGGSSSEDSDANFNQSNPVGGAAGGNGGSNSGAINVTIINEEEYKKKTPEQKINILRDGLGEKYKDLRNTNEITIIAITTNCSSNARVVNGKVQLCNRFFERSYNVQLSILAHELFHIMNDKPTSFEKHILETPYRIPNVPENIREYAEKQCLMDGLNPNIIGQESFNNYVNEKLSIVNLMSKDYNQNEVNAYRFEKETFEGDQDYSDELEFNLWFHEECLKFINNK